MYKRQEVYLAIWIVVFTLLGLYLLGKLRFAHDDELKHISVTQMCIRDRFEIGCGETAAVRASLTWR